MSMSNVVPLVLIGMKRISFDLLSEQRCDVMSKECEVKIQSTKLQALAVFLIAYRIFHLEEQNQKSKVLYVHIRL
jgi:hypothetical protein